MVIKNGRAAWSHAGALHGGTPSPPRIAAEPPSRVGALGTRGLTPCPQFKADAYANRKHHSPSSREMNARPEWMAQRISGKREWTSIAHLRRNNRQNRLASGSA